MDALARLSGVRDRRARVVDEGDDHPGSPEPGDDPIDRWAVDEVAFARPASVDDEPSPHSHLVTVVDVSTRGARLRVASDTLDLRVGSHIELGIEGRWAMCRVAWSARVPGSQVIGGVTYVDAQPAFMSTISTWIARAGGAGTLYAV